jgi:glyceraldehyde 3-phosphate dehydrogenase
MGGNLVKVMSWYDNEMGFSHRMLDLAAYMGRKMGK